MLSAWSQQELESLRKRFAESGRINVGEGPAPIDESLEKRWAALEAECAEARESVEAYSIDELLAAAARAGYGQLRTILARIVVLHGRAPAPVRRAIEAKVLAFVDALLRRLIASEVEADELEAAIRAIYVALRGTPLVARSPLGQLLADLAAAPAPAPSEETERHEATTRADKLIARLMGRADAASRIIGAKLQALRHEGKLGEFLAKFEDRLLDVNGVVRERFAHAIAIPERMLDFDRRFKVASSFFPEGVAAGDGASLMGGAGLGKFAWVLALDRSTLIREGYEAESDIVRSLEIGAAGAGTEEAPAEEAVADGVGLEELGALEGVGLEEEFTGLAGFGPLSSEPLFVPVAGAGLGAGAAADWRLSPLRGGARTSLTGAVPKAALQAIEKKDADGLAAALKGKITRAEAKAIVESRSPLQALRGALGDSRGALDHIALGFQSAATAEAREAALGTLGRLSFGGTGGGLGYVAGTSSAYMAHAMRGATVGGYASGYALPSLTTAQAAALAPSLSPVARRGLGLDAQPPAAAPLPTLHGPAQRFSYTAGSEYLAREASISTYAIGSDAFGVPRYRGAASISPAALRALGFDLGGSFVVAPERGLGTAGERSFGYSCDEFGIIRLEKAPRSTSGREALAPRAAGFEGVAGVERLFRAARGEFAPLTAGGAPLGQLRYPKVADALAAPELGGSTVPVGYRGTAPEMDFGGAAEGAPPAAFAAPPTTGADFFGGFLPLGFAPAFPLIRRGGAALGRGFAPRFQAPRAGAFPGGFATSVPPLPAFWGGPGAASFAGTRYARLGGAPSWRPSFTPSGRYFVGSTPSDLHFRTPAAASFGYAETRWRPSGFDKYFRTFESPRLGLGRIGSFRLSSFAPPGPRFAPAPSFGGVELGSWSLPRVSPSWDVAGYAPAARLGRLPADIARHGSLADGRYARLGRDFGALERTYSGSRLWRGGDRGVTWSTPALPRFATGGAGGLGGSGARFAARPGAFRAPRAYGGAPSLGALDFHMPSMPPAPSMAFGAPASGFRFTGGVPSLASLRSGAPRPGGADAFRLLAWRPAGFAAPRLAGVYGDASSFAPSPGDALGLSLAGGFEAAHAPTALVPRFSTLGMDRSIRPVLGGTGTPRLPRFEAAPGYYAADTAGLAPSFAAPGLETGPGGAGGAGGSGETGFGGGAIAFAAPRAARFAGVGAASPLGGHPAAHGFFDKLGALHGAAPEAPRLPSAPPAAPRLGGGVASPALRLRSEPAPRFGRGPMTARFSLDGWAQPALELPTAGAAVGLQPAGARTLDLGFEREFGRWKAERSVRSPAGVPLDLTSQLAGRTDVAALSSELGRERGLALASRNVHMPLTGLFRAPKRDVAEAAFALGETAAPAPLDSTLARGASGERHVAPRRAAPPQVEAVPGAKAPATPAAAAGPALAKVPERSPIAPAGPGAERLLRKGETVPRPFLGRSLELPVRRSGPLPRRPQGAPTGESPAAPSMEHMARGAPAAPPAAPAPAAVHAAAPADARRRRKDEDLDLAFVAAPSRTAGWPVPVATPAGEAAGETLLFKRAAGGGPPAMVVAPDSRLGRRIRAERGRPLSAPVLSFMERFLKQNLGAVKVADGAEAQALNRDLGSEAFVVGDQVFLGREAAGDDARRLGTVAHELSHVADVKAGALEPEVIRVGAGRSEAEARALAQARASERRAQSLERQLMALQRAKQKPRTARTPKLAMEMTGIRQRPATAPSAAAPVQKSLGSRFADTAVQVIDMAGEAALQGVERLLFPRPQRRDLTPLVYMIWQKMKREIALNRERSAGGF